MFQEINNFLNTGKILGIDVLPLIIGISFVIIVIWLIFTRKIKKKEFKPLDLKKQVKEDLNEEYKYFSLPINKFIYSGLSKIGFAIGYMPMMWNKKLKKFKGIKNLRGKKQKEIDNPIEVYAIKVCSKNRIKKEFAKRLGRIGRGTRYFIIDKSMINITDEGIFFDANIQRRNFFGQFIFSTSAKNIVEDISFRINRQNELQEIANITPRVVFFDTELSKRLAIERERAEIEKEKFRGQKESAQD